MRQFRNHCIEPAVILQRRDGNQRKQDSFATFSRYQRLQFVRLAGWAGNHHMPAG